MQNSIKKTLIYFFPLISSFLFFPAKAGAICPLCTVAVGAGVGLSRWLGIDDIITGLWVGGLTVSMIIWTISWLDKKNINFRGRNVLTIIGYYFLIIVPLYLSHIIGNPLNILCGCPFLDKLLLGIGVGSFGFWSGVSWHNFLKEKNNGRVYFAFQKVLIPVLPLLLLSVIFYYLRPIAK